MTKQVGIALGPVAAGILLQFANALGQTVTSLPARDEGAPTVYEVVVTGSNIPTTERVVVTASTIATAAEAGPNRVDIYRKTDLERLGVTSMSEFSQMLPAATGAAINDNRVNGGDGRAEINLRGILPKHTLVLVDGRRVAPVGFAGDTVDLNLLPLPLIDHVDVLKDGASAIYGTDAIDGVVNISLIHHFRGLEFGASYGNTNLGFANESATRHAYLLAGTGDDKTDIVIYADAYDRSAIYSRDADLSSNADYTRFGGQDRRSAYYAGRIAFFQYVPSLNGGALSPTPHAYAWPGSDPQYVVRTLPGIPPVPNPILGRGGIALNVNDLTAAIGAANRQFSYLSFDRKIYDKYLAFFSDFKYARTSWSADLGPSPFFPDVFTDASHPEGISSEAGISVPLQNAFNPFTGPGPFIYTSPGGFDPRVPGSESSAAPPGTRFITLVGYTATEAGPHIDKITTENTLVTAGLKGDLGWLNDYFRRWDWEVAFRYNEDSRDELEDGVLDRAALRTALLDTNPATAFNPFGLNQNTPSVLKRVFVTTHRTGDTSLMLEDFKLHGELFKLPAGQLAFATGTEHRTEYANDIPDPRNALSFASTAEFAENLSAIGVPLLGPTRGSRDVWSTWWEFRVPITSPTWNSPGFYSLELDYQERFELYSDFGDTERPKFCFRWQPLDSALTLRGTYTEAFHAPTLRDLFESDRLSFPIVKANPVTEEPLIIGQALIGGNPKIQPETAYEWTYGAIITPAKWWSGLEGLTVMLDFYHIDARDIITSLDPVFLYNHSSQFPRQVIPGGPGTVQLVTTHQNLGRFIEEGWDYEAVYTLDTARFGHGDFGTLTAILNGTYLQRAVLQTAPGNKRENVLGKFGGGFEGAQGGGSFTHNRFYASLFYRGAPTSFLGGVDLGVTIRYVGQYNDLRGAANNPSGNRKVREWAPLNVVVSYTFGLARDHHLSGYSKDTKEPSECSACGWKAWLDGTTITTGVNNLLDKSPPFVAGALENGYDESTADIKGRFWYAGIKKRF